MSYTAAERETTLQTDDESGKWIVHTYQSKIMTKLRKANVNPVQEFADGGARYELDFNQVSFRAKSSDRPKRVMSEAHKAKLKAARNNKKQ